MDRGSRHRADLVGGALWSLLGAAIVVACWRMDRFTQMGATLYTMPGLVPGIVGGVLVLLGGVLMLRAWRAHAAEVAARLVSDPLPPLVNARVLGFGGLCLAYALGLVGRVPFWLGTALFVTAAIGLFSPKDQPRARRFGLAVLIGVVTAVVIATVFERVFLVRLP
jgi:hypothetical protein